MGSAGLPPADSSRRSGSRETPASQPTPIDSGPRPQHERMVAGELYEA